MIYVATRTGKQHNKSEDTVLVGKVIVSDDADILPTLDCGFICVADGVGGNQGGAQASAFLLGELAAVDTIENAESLKSLLSEINSRLIAIGQAEPSIASMATTLTGVYLNEGARFLMHIGNTRAFIRQGKYLKQITQDHTVFNWLQKSGRLDEAETCNKNEITNCFGGGDKSLLSKLYVTEIPDFSQLLLTSDGVHEHVDIDLLEDILNEDSPGEDKCNKILDAAITAGSEDDISVILACIKEE